MWLNDSWGLSQCWGYEWQRQNLRTRRCRKMLTLLRTCGWEPTSIWTPLRLSGLLSFLDHPGVTRWIFHPTPQLPRCRRGWGCVSRSALTVETFKSGTRDQPLDSELLTGCPLCSLKVDHRNGLQEWAHCFLASFKWYTGELMAGGSWKEIGKFRQFFSVLPITIPVESNCDNH